MILSKNEARKSLKAMRAIYDCGAHMELSFWHSIYCGYATATKIACGAIFVASDYRNKQEAYSDIHEFAKAYGIEDAM